MAWSIVICLSWWVSPAYSLFAPPQTAARSHAAPEPARGEADKERGKEAERMGGGEGEEEMKRVRMRQVGEIPSFSDINRKNSE